MHIVLGVANGSIPIWEILDNDIMFNHLVASKSLIRKLKTIRHRGIGVWVDSGGYQILKKGLKISIDELLRRYRMLNADYYMSLDLPVPSIRFASVEVVRRNISNFVEIVQRLPDHTIIPVVHLYPSDLLIWAVEKYLEYDPPIIAYGGVVPSTLNRRESRLRSLLGFLILRKYFPNVRFHVLGLGSYVMVRILKALGAWSIDTSTWRVKAAYGHVIIPGMGERYVGSRKIRFGTPPIKPEEIEILYRELRRSRFPLIDRFYELISSFKGRAIINAWVITRIDGGISRRSSFYRLYKQIVEFAQMSIDELVEIYDGGKEAS